MKAVSNRTVIRILIALNLILATFLGLGFLNNRKLSSIGPEYLIKELQLDPNQIMQYKVLLDSNKVILDPLLLELRRTKKDLFAQISQENPSEDTLLRLESANNAIQSKIDRAMLKHMREVYKFCNNAQKNKLLDVIHKLNEHPQR